MDKLYRIARKRVGLPKFERESRRIYYGDGGSVKAYCTPGTPEHGQWTMLERAAWDRVHKWRQGLPYADEMPPK